MFFIIPFLFHRFKYSGCFEALSPDAAKKENKNIRAAELIFQRTYSTIIMKYPENQNRRKEISAFRKMMPSVSRQYGIVSQRRQNPVSHIALREEAAMKQKKKQKNPESQESSPSLYLFDSFNDPSGSGQMVLEEVLSDIPEDGSPAVPFDLIQTLMLSLSTGDDKLLRQYLDRLSVYAHVFDKLTSADTIVCSLCAALPLYAMASISCGASAAKSYALLNAMLKSAQQAEDAETARQLSRQAVFQFQQLVNEALDVESASDHIRLSKSYIFNHLNQELTPASIAKAVGLNKNYLMGLFMQEEGVSLMQFVKTERLKAAALLLKCTSYGVAEIAAEFQFKSPSHFTAEFRRMFQMTPTQYRKKHMQPYLEEN